MDEPSACPPIEPDDNERQASPDHPFFQEGQDVVATWGPVLKREFEAPVFTHSAIWGHVFRARIVAVSPPALGMYEQLVCWKAAGNTNVDFRWSVPEGGYDPHSHPKGRDAD